MKVSVVPAQVTTIEDRIAGNLGMSQLALLILPMLLGSLMFVALPPTMHAALYKLMLIAGFALTCCLMAIRIKGKILLLWCVVLLRYNLRPGFFVYDRRSLAGRTVSTSPADPPEATETRARRSSRQLSNLTTAEIARAKAYLEEPAAQLAFTISRKGDLRVRITEVKD